MTPADLPAGITLTADADLSTRNTLRLPGRAQWLADVDEPRALVAMLASPQWRSVRRQVLGGGSNVVLAGDVDGLVIQPRFASRSLHVQQGEAMLEVDAGHDWAALVAWSVSQGWAGLENLGLIPGQCGAAPIQNIGAYGVELEQRLAWVEWLDLRTGEVRRYSKDQCGFAYRDSWFKRQEPGALLVLRIGLVLARAMAMRVDYPGLREQLEADGVTVPAAHHVHAAVCALRRRKLPDPATLPNAGSFFKNPLVDPDRAARLREEHPTMPQWPQADGRCKLSAGWMIEQAGFKGARRGAVGVAPGHALVLVHHGGGSGAQLLALAAEIIGAVRQRFDVVLEPEPVQIPAP